MGRRSLHPAGDGGDGTGGRSGGSPRRGERGDRVGRGVWDGMGGGGGVRHIATIEAEDFLSARTVRGGSGRMAPMAIMYVR